MKLKPGDRVQHVSTTLLASPGTVERADDYVVQVKWDDGTTGFLYWDDSMIPNARYLEKLHGPAR